MATLQSQWELDESQATTLYQTGELLKRQRGVHPRGLDQGNKSKRKFQMRWFELKQDALEYYKKEADRRSKEPRGSFPVRQIRIVEAVPQKTFGVDFCFQVGDDDEVMYLAAKSLEEMDKWMEEFRNAAKDSGNMMMAKYHTGVYDHRRRAWSCCQGEKEKSDGCCPVRSLERCQSEKQSQLGGRGKIKRWKSEGYLFQQQFDLAPRKLSQPPKPQPSLRRLRTQQKKLSDSAEALGLAPKHLPQPPKPQPSLHRQQMELSDIIIPSSRIKLVETLGEVCLGRFGVVYKAHLLNEEAPSQEIVVLKTPRDPQVLTELKQDLARLKALVHPHVMHLIGICKDGQTPGIIMPFMKNGSLLSYVKKEKDLLVPTDTKMEEAKVKQTRMKLTDMCLQIVKGMQYLAEKKFVHCDLAARNCMVDSQRVIKVANFGLTEEIYCCKNCHQDNQASALLPLKWMAPESSTHGDFSEKSDVWSFGITCWEVLSGGKMPYEGISPYAVLSFLQEGGRLEKPQNAACSVEMFQIMKTCWDISPEKRPTFSELMRSIEAREDDSNGYITITEASPQMKTEHEAKPNTAEDFLEWKHEEKESEDVNEHIKAQAATEVFKKNFPQMLKTVDVNAPNLAAAFYAEGVISDDVLEEFYSNTSKNQTLKLLHSVLKIIETHPECFSKVCTALEKDYASTAKSLKDEFKSYLEELTKDKANGEHKTPTNEPSKGETSNFTQTEN